MFKEHVFGPEIYLKQPPPIHIDQFRSFFSKYQRALNPIAVATYANFNYNVTNLLYQQLQKTRVKHLDPIVVRDYLSLEKKHYKNFNSDMSLLIKETDEEGNILNVASGTGAKIP